MSSYGHIIQYSLLNSQQKFVFTAGSHAGGAREPGQAGNRAAINGRFVVPGKPGHLFLLWHIRY